MLLKKMGWKDNTGLGRDGSGIVDPIRLEANIFNFGLGKKAEVDHYTNSENVKRKLLEAEKDETEVEKVRREEKAEKIESIKQELAEIKKSFYCELCNKQYKMISEYETHLSSYDHNHKKRFTEMSKMDGAKRKEERMKREEKQREKEMKQLEEQIARAA
eukprot:TRINITY_DN1569_c0_g1_i2.p1 TRINITY_DN1569_c0_g1~~TRINITY_DN1569_c0_g1_i2.p1  ORF type:complete len:160 (+),score=37.81 TRINITY_DN1569_c0_g1_i2:98-577(+)